jgi:hypothetical protein
VILCVPCGEPFVTAEDTGITGQIAVQPGGKDVLRAPLSIHKIQQPVDARNEIVGSGNQA